MHLSRWLLFLASAAACVGCESSKPEGAGENASPLAVGSGASGPLLQASAAPLPLEAGLLPLPADLAFSPTKGPPPLALPTGCVRSSPFEEAPFPERALFAVSPTVPGALAVADGTEGELSLRHAGLVTPGAPSTPLGWLIPSDTPKLAQASDGTRLSAFALPKLPGRLDRVGLARGPSLELVAEGDGFVAVDLACNATCALLTTPLAKVETPGATLFWGPPSASVASWQRLDLSKAASTIEARPLAVGFDGDRPTAALLEHGTVAFVGAATNGVSRLSEVAVAHTVLDVLVAPPLVVSHGGPLTDEGCSEAPPSLVLSRPAAEPVVVPIFSAPTIATLRAIKGGSVLAWMGPAACQSTRHVVYAVLLDGEGHPRGAPVPVGDADGFALAASNERVEMWLQQGPLLRRASATCAL